MTVLGTPVESLPWALSAVRSEQIEATLRDTVLDVAGGLAEPLLRVVCAGGKRLRPALTLAIASTEPGHPSDRDVVALAAAVELLHCATLVHDDLIDRAPTRRNVATLSAREGLPAAVVGGDLLIAAAVRLASGVSGHAASVIAETLAQLCRGEVIQEQCRFDPDVSLDDLIGINAAKTGSLLRAAALLGASSSGGRPELVDAAAKFGLDFGISLQLIDDLLDIVSTPALAGKPVHGDFTAGTLTYPAALALRERPELRQYLRPDLSVGEARIASDLLRNAHRSIAETIAVAREFATTAVEALSAILPEIPTGAGVTSWPSAYLDDQLWHKTGRRHQSLLARLMSSAG